MNKVRVILLDGNKAKAVYIDKDNGIEEVRKLLNTKSSLGYHSFGDGYATLGEVYIMFWQTERKEKTSMEITTKAGAPDPIFIDSKVVIVSEDLSKDDLVDINIENVKTHFNTNNAYWSLIRN